MRKRTPRQHRDPMGWVKARTPLANDQTRDLGLAYHMALQSLLSGHGTEQTWSTLACSLNIALVLAENGNGADCIETIKLSQGALLRSRERAQRTGKWGFDGEGIRIILAAINIHDEQIGNATRGQVITALEEVNRRVEQNEVFS